MKVQHQKISNYKDEIQKKKNYKGENWKWLILQEVKHY